MLRLLLTLALAAACLGQAGSALAQAELRIAVEGAYPPFNYVEANEAAGFEPELGKALCQAMGLPCSFVLQDWDGLFAGLRENRYDAIMSSIEITEKRRHRYAFSKAYYRIPSALIAAKSADLPPAPFKTEQLAGRSVGVVDDTEFKQHLETSVGAADLRKYHRLEEATLDLLTGRIEFVLGDKLELWRFLGSREGKTCCRFVTDLSVDRGEGYGVAMRRGDKGLAAMFDAAIDRVIADGTYDRIRAKYVAFDIK